VKHREEVNGVIADWISERTREEVAAILDAKGLPYSLVFDMEDAFNNEQYLAREMLVRVLDKQLGDAIVQNVVPKFSKTPGAVKHLGPTLGEHNEEVYGGELGYSPERLAELRAAGVI
jgi:formyl-CoA transferase